ncbi:MAG: aspartate kinase [Luteibaculum sp.]
MRIYKFGGASVKDGEGVLNLAKIVAQCKAERLVVVVSAMDKTTNALEEVYHAWQSKQVDVALQKIEDSKIYHHKIIRSCFDGLSCEPVINDVNEYFKQLQSTVSGEVSDIAAADYDKLVSYGELISTRIVYQQLKKQGLDVLWTDASKLIRTDNSYRKAKVNWEKTEAKIQDFIASHSQQIIVSQGFIGGTPEGHRTTLGREGSDFSGAIFAYALNAKSLTIWKDVPGLLNADPRVFPNTKKLEEISYREALELSYYGASVIHPKTVKPLQNKGIPLYIKPFLNPVESGTTVHEKDSYDADVPSFIVKNKQRLVSISPRDFSFVVEENLMDLFAAFNKHGITANLMQNSAISFSVCVEEEADLSGLIAELQDRYQVLYNNQVSLITIRHYNPEIIRELTEGKTVLVEQRTRTTVRFVCS